MNFVSLYNVISDTTVMKNILAGLSILLWSILHTGYADTSGCKGCLILTPFIKNGSASEARKLSQIDDKNYYGIISHTGFITVKETYNSNLFFWFFPHQFGLAMVPWIIWLQGGPGFSSLVGLFDMFGPIKIEDGTVKLRNVTWASDYSLLFIDNPVGAGFSFTEDERGYVNNEDDVGEQLLEFIQQFLEMFPELRTAPLFITGESYGGKYVPAFGIQIQRHKTDRHPINLKGLAIGNGLIDPRSMMHYSDLVNVIGILDDSHIERLRVMEENVVKLIDEVRMVDAANKFNETIEFIKKNSGISVYNFNRNPSNGLPSFESYINRPDVRDVIHVGNASFNYNNQVVYKKMLPDIMNSTKPFIQELLEHYGVMSYSGQLDIIVAYSLSKHTYKLLEWSGRQEYERAPRKRLRRFINGTIVGYKKSGGNFTEVLVRNAGHMVPVDQPEVAKFIIDRFIDEYK
ncbi:venom serine carboxypeptidase [Manduca sexta]|uniref:Carboxypeptidase n=1 Tax=Manduca sexta TaxID=7130 RepID=A0A922CLM0_MANSE|nr:venom serine carboxypeptidase [Manduca sexta]KAG6450424.1 hypothetical protein O3G_MSEX006583 [Manduca sexta]